MAVLPTRVLYAALTAITVTLGLAVHFTGDALAPAARDVIGDALWASMIFWITGILAPHAHVIGRAASAVAVCVAVEASQLLDMEWLVALRNTIAGHLVLGNDFDPRDLVAYFAGVTVVAIAEFASRRRHGTRKV